MVARLRRLPAGALRAGSVGAVQVATERVKLGWRFEVDGAVISAVDIPRPRTKKHLPELFFQQSRVGQRPWTPSLSGKSDPPPVTVVCLHSSRRYPSVLCCVAESARSFSLAVEWKPSAAARTARGLRCGAEQARKLCARCAPRELCKQTTVTGGGSDFPEIRERRWPYTDSWKSPLWRRTGEKTLRPL